MTLVPPGQPLTELAFAALLLMASSACGTASSTPSTPSNDPAKPAELGQPEPHASASPPVVSPSCRALSLPNPQPDQDATGTWMVRRHNLACAWQPLEAKSWLTIRDESLLAQSCNGSAIPSLTQGSLIAPLGDVIGTQKLCSNAKNEADEILVLAVRLGRGLIRGTRGCAWLVDGKGVPLLELGSDEETECQSQIRESDAPIARFRETVHDIIPQVAPLSFEEQAALLRRTCASGDVSACSIERHFLRRDSLPESKLVAACLGDVPKRTGGWPNAITACGSNHTDISLAIEGHLIPTELRTMVGCHLSRTACHELHRRAMSAGDEEKKSAALILEKSCRSGRDQSCLLAASLIPDTVSAHLLRLADAARAQRSRQPFSNEPRPPHSAWYARRFSLSSTWYSLPAPVVTNWVGENFTVQRTLAPNLSLNRSRDLVAALLLTTRALERVDACLFAQGYFQDDIEFAPMPTTDCHGR